MQALYATFGNSLPLRGLPLQEGECYFFLFLPKEEVDSTAPAVEDGGVLKYLIRTQLYHPK